MMGKEMPEGLITAGINGRKWVTAAISNMGDNGTYEIAAMRVRPG